MTSAAPAADPAAITWVPIEQLYPHPKNPRPRLRADDDAIVKLRASIQRDGQLEPCLVRPLATPMFGREGFEIVRGHRRKFVGELMRAERLPCYVRELSDQEAVVSMLSSSEEHEAPDPFMEADLMEQLATANGWSYREVASRLGRAPATVALRANLAKVDSQIRKMWQGGELTGWRLGWLEELGRLALEAQRSLVSLLPGVSSRRELEQLLGDKLRKLEHAPWRLEDALLDQKAGACTTCPHTSLRSPGLFDHQGELSPEDPTTLRKHAICRLAECWSRKSELHQKSQIEAKREKLPEAPLVLERYGARVPKGLERSALKPQQYAPSRKGEKGAVQAIVVDAEKAGRTIWIQPSPSAVEGKKVEGDEKPPSKLEEARASFRELVERRQREVDELTRDLVLGLRAPDIKVMQGLLVSFGASPSERTMSAKSFKAAFGSASRAHPAIAISQAWPLVRQEVASLWPLPSPSAPNYSDWRAVADWVVEVLGVDLEPLRKKAEKKIVEPGWWRSLDRRCRGCGLKAGLSLTGRPWTEFDLCSLCSGSRPTGKKTR